MATSGGSGVAVGTAAADAPGEAAADAPAEGDGDAAFLDVPNARGATLKTTATSARAANVRATILKRFVPYQA